MPALLLIDTCGLIGYVAVIDAERPQSPLSAVTLPGRETQELLLSSIDSVLRRAQLVPTKLSAIAVVTGPGSFTGVRIGLAAAKGLAEACNLPLLALSRLAVLARAARSYTAADGITAWIDAGRTDLYTATFMPGRPTPEQAMLPRAAALQAAADTVVAVEDPTLAALVPGTLVLAESEIQQSIANLAAEMFAKQTFAETALLDANYLRVPDAETALLARQAAAAP